MKIETYMDHTLLKSDARAEDIGRLCEEALTYHFYSICVNSSHISTCKKILQDRVKITTVVGFPLGACLSEVKAFEAQLAVRDGADEIDMVLNIGKLKDQDYEFVLNDIKMVKEAIGDKVLKVILESCLLTKDEIREACKIILRSGADFVKTSTGFSHAGANLKDIAIIKEIIGDQIGIKASGGIRKLQDALHFISAGATRLGVSSSVSIMKESSNNNHITEEQYEAY